jgi:hypothetical protein
VAGAGVVLGEAAGAGAGEATAAAGAAIAAGATNAVNASESAKIQVRAIVIILINLSSAMIEAAAWRCPRPWPSGQLCYGQAPSTPVNCAGYKPACRQPQATLRIFSHNPAFTGCNCLTTMIAEDSSL